MTDNPLLGRARDDLVAGVRSVLVHPHVVFYRVNKYRVDVVRVLHQRMDVERVFVE